MQTSSDAISEATASSDDERPYARLNWVSAFEWKTLVQLAPVASRAEGRLVDG